MVQDSGSGCNQVRNCGLGLHADQTAEMVRILYAFELKGLIFPICIAEGKREAAG